VVILVLLFSTLLHYCLQLQKFVISFHLLDRFNLLLIDLLAWADPLKRLKLHLQMTFGKDPLAVFCSIRFTHGVWYSDSVAEEMRDDVTSKNVYN
jgi:hypothetical protein